MGRKRNASSRLQDTMPESTNLSVRAAELKPKNNDSLEKVNIQPESAKKTSRKTTASVRRSERLQNVVAVSRSLDVERVIEEITLSESEKEHTQLDKEVSEPTLNAKNLEEKMDHHLHLLEAQQKAIRELNSKTTNKGFFDDSSSAGEITYKSLYIDSQKKVEALMDENHQLTKKLENALGKIEAYEKGNLVISEVLDKLKNLILLSSLERPTGTATNLPSEVARGSFAAVDTGFGSPIVFKRKRLDKETKN